MNVFRATLLVMLVLLVPGVSGAQTQMELNDQAKARFQRSDAALNQVWKRLTALLDASVKNKLTQAQLAWIKFRDAEAEARSATVEGGSMAPMMYWEAKADLTEARTRALEAWSGPAGPYLEQGR